MLRGIRNRLTYANVMATVALFIALGGVSYAAVKLPRNSVGGTQIKRDAITGANVKNSSLTGSDIKDRSLTAADFNGSVAGPAGPAGAAGAKGDAGATGPAGPLLDVLPSGHTLEGVYDIGGTATAAGNLAQGSVSFAVPMPAELIAHFISSFGVVPAACTGGTVAAPRADAGHLCVFEKAASSHAAIDDSNIDSPVTNFAGKAGRFGFGIIVQASASSGFYGSRGTWAATAP